jgi:hypothetical protein
MEASVKKALVFVLLLPLLACGDDSTEPGLELDGTWRFTFGNMTGSYIGIAVSCNATAVDFTLTQTGNTFSGVQVGSGRITCSGGGQTLLDNPVANLTIVEGTVAGNTIAFRLGLIAGQHNATVTGTSMTGTAQWILASPQASVTVNGQFTAAKM